jgi:hypothetical protein
MASFQIIRKLLAGTAAAAAEASRSRGPSHITEPKKLAVKNRSSAGRVNKEQPPAGKKSLSRGKKASAKQCCGSGMFIPDPDFYPSRIPDPKTATKEMGEKK